MKNSEKILHEKFVEYGADAKKWMQKCVLLLPEINRLRIWEKQGFGSIYEYAAKLAGMGKNTVNDALRIMAKVEDKPELRKVVGERGVWAVKPVLSVATRENEGFWAKKARIMSRDTLRMYIREKRRAGPPIDAEQKPVKTILSLDLSPEIASQLEKLKGENWDETIEKLLVLRREKLNEEKPDIVSAVSRSIPASIEKFVLRRSNRKCEFPFCKLDYTALHHADRFGLVKKHDPDRIFALCREHHDLAHRGLVEGEDMDVKFWRVQEDEDKTDIRHLIDRRVVSYCY